MSEKTNQRLVRTTSKVAFLVALVTFCTIPTIYLTTALYYEYDQLSADAADQANNVAGMVYLDPEHWLYQEERLAEMLSRHRARSRESHWRVQTPGGQTIISLGRRPAFPAIAATADVDNGDGIIARIVVAESLRPVIFRTAGIALISMMLSLAIFWALKLLPLGALKRAVGDLERSEALLRGAKETAEVANRTKSEFLANISHELRTPLNAIIGFSEIIKDQTFGPVGSVQYRDYANDIHQSGQHLLALVNDILDLSKIESGKDELQDTDVDIPTTVRAIKSFVADRAGNAGLKLIWDVPNDLPRLRADERKLKQMLVNLLSNAVKFTPTGGEVTLKVWCGAGDGCVFQVIDTGIGMAPTDLPKAMSQFGQIDGSLTRQHDGTGLGLPLTKSLIEAHGGRLDLHSEFGSGTTVSLCFPAARIVGLPAGAPPVGDARRAG